MHYIVISLFQTVVVCLLAVAGILLGRRFWSVRSRIWIVAYGVPLFIVAAISMSRWIPQMEFVPPFKWLMAGRTEFAVMALVCAMLLTTPLSRLPQRRQRRAVFILMILFVVYFSVLPFLMPALEYSNLINLETRLDGNGICLQSTHYNCGPAAAVTILRSIGVPAEEGKLSLCAHTTRVTGTPMDSLCYAMRREYAVPCHIVYCRDVRELLGKGPFVAIIKFSFFIDHYVAVLLVTESMVTVGDPLNGLMSYTHKEFEEKWRGCAIIIDKVAERSGLNSCT